MYTLGSTLLSFQLGNVSFEHKFTVISDNVDIYADGLMGLDFFLKYKVRLDFFTNTFALTVNDKLITVPVGGTTNTDMAHQSADSKKTTQLVGDSITSPPTTCAVKCIVNKQKNQRSNEQKCKSEKFFIDLNKEKISHQSQLTIIHRAQKIVLKEYVTFQNILIGVETLL